MTDLEITKKCAEAIGWELFEENGELWEKAGLIIYDPLHDDAQAMALVKKFHLSIINGTSFKKHIWLVDGKTGGWSDADLNRAICEAVAKMVKK